MPAKKTVEQEVPDIIHHNMRFYGQVQDTPQEARKEIAAGRLKGYTDINPMWRIKKLTEIFGPVGYGWWTQNEKYDLHTCSNGEVAVFCTLELIIVDPETNEQSHPITGIGGNKVISNERNGVYCNDEAYKMAYTDALSIACKALGFSHDIYYQKDRTKYTALSSDDAPAAEVNTTEIVSRIQKGINFLTKDMNNEQKDKFVMDVVVPKIGNPNYMACKDMSKLQALLDTLLTMSKAKAA